MRHILKAVAVYSVANPLVRLLVGFCAAAAGAFSAIANRAYAHYLWPHAQRQDVYLHWNTRVKYPERVTFGISPRIGPKCVLGAMGTIRLGDHFRMSEGACLETGGLDTSRPAPYEHIAKPIVIGDGVWIGFGAIVLGGVTIGDRSVIGAGAVVSKDVPPDSIVVGSPARFFQKTPSGA
jgi:acetyltransferase-like isoleucine patch superfamily enzyme